jgi:cellulose 1,4-beta-cellobiosidase
MRLLRKLRRFAASVTVVLLGAGGLGAAAAVVSPSANAATGCSVAYTVPSQWNTGFTANIVITNLGSPLTSWNLGYSYSGNQTLQSGWNGTWTQSGANVTVANAAWNGSVATSGTVTIGANFNYSGTNTSPTTFTLNGVTCTGGVTGTTGSIQASATTLSVAQGATGTVGISLSAAPSANVTVTTARTSGNTGLSVSGGSSLTFTPANFATAQNVTFAADTTSTGSATFTVSATGYPSITITVNETTGTTTGSIQATSTSLSVTQGTTGTVGISLSAAPAANVTVTTARTAGNTGLSVTGGSSLTFTPANFATAQGVTFTADSSSTGSATFTVSATGYPSITITVTETSNTGGGGHVADPFAGSKPYLNPDYVKEVQAQATADGSSAEAAVAKYQTAIWLDTISAIAGGGSTGRTGLQAQLTAAAAAGTAATPSLVEIVIYDLPGRDCAALASNGEIPGTTAGLTEYETQYINPIASILSQFATSNIRVVAIIEPDSLPNVVTNQSIAACSTATPLYEAGITYALNKLHAISNVYNYMDIAHSAWLGWPNNMSATPAVYNKVVQATTAGYASIDGFISDTANYTPTQEPLLTNPTLQINGQNVDSATFYQFNPTFDELTYDTQMYNTLVAAGFPSSKKFLIDTSRNGWGPTHPTTITSASDVNTYVADNKIDKRPFRGDWCNQNNAGIGARPTDQPFGSSSPILAFVWIKPPGESDGDYPTSTHTHGDPHCDPNGTNTDGNGNTYSTGSIPGFDVPAGQWFAVEFQMLVKNAYPAMS